MKIIYKYPITHERNILLPIGAEILTIQTQHGEPMMWALVDPKAKTEDRMFEVFGTGQEILYDIGVERKYIGTFQVNGGMLVYYLFERIKPS